MRSERHPLQPIWCAMKRRCDLPTVNSYARYGGRGIRVCDRWAASFLCFALDMGMPKPGESLERIDNDGDYEPGNCRWATRPEQARNRSSNVMVTAFGETRVAFDWIGDPRCAVRYDTLLYRLRSGWSPLDALTMKPLPKPGRPKAKKETVYANVG